MEPQWSSQRQQQQQQQRPPVGLSPQQTGWSSMQQPNQQQYMQPQQTGMLGPGMAMMQQRPMQTGMGMPMQMQATGGFSSSSAYGAPPPPPVPSLPRMYQQNTGYPQPMMPQATGYPGQGGSMLGSFNAVPSTFVSTFMPSNPNAQWNSGPGQYTQQQTAQAPAPLPQYFEQHNQQTMGQTVVSVQWALTADERKNYDQIFRAWDQGSGFITGQRAQEVFKESGLERDDLMKVWALADRENRGKLNLAEFHVAMGLIYRKLSGNPIPDVLPQELIPPSARDLDQSVDFLKDLLRNDTNSRSTNLDVNQQSNTNKYAKVRSFAPGASPEPNASRKDATVYRHDDADTRTYQSSSRHLDRRNVRFQGEDEDTELGRMKRELQSSAEMLDTSRKDEAEDDDIRAELEDLQYRIRRVKDDIEYNRSGRRTEAKEQERRRLERELLFLQHEKFPEVEAKMRERERTKRSEDRSAARQRDARNSSNRHDRETRQKDDEVRRPLDEEDDHTGYNKGSYSKSSDTEKRTRFQDDDDTTRPSSRGTDSPASTALKAQKPADEAPVAPTPPLEAPKPASPAPPARKAQTPEERQAFIRAEAQRRVQERMRLLTGHSPTASPNPEQLQPTIDSSVSERMESERKAAAERAKAEDSAAAEREKVRQMKLEEERLGRVKKEQQSLKQDTKALQQVSDEVTASEMNDSSSGKTASTAAREELDEEEKAIRAKEAQLKDERRKREERLKQLQAEIEESDRQERELLEKKSSSGPQPAAKKSAPPPPASRGGKAPAPKPPVSRNVAAEAFQSSPAPQAPSAPPVAPPAPTVPSPSADNSTATTSAPLIASPVPVKPTNPFHRMTASNPAASPSPSFASPAAPSGSGKNPFFRPPTGAAPAPAAPSPPPAPPAPAAPPAQKSAGRTEEDWGDIKDLSNDDSSDSSDDEDSGPSTRQTRAGLADLLFGGNSSAPSSRPGSARPTTPASNAPAAPKASAAALAQLGGSPPPRSALLGAIQAGASLRKTVTADRSKAPGAGNVIGDASPPVRGPTASSAEQDHDSPRSSYEDAPAAPKSPEPGLKPSNPNRQSVDWYGGLAADTYPSPTFPSQNGQLPTMQEESEDEAAADTEHQGKETAGSSQDDSPESEFNMTASIRARSLYPYQAQRSQDASFGENLLIIAHPAKNPSNEWLYGIVPSTGARGLLPKSYVEELSLNITAKLLYDYQGQTEDELKVQEGASVVIGEKLDGEWARAIHDGKVGLVPLTYLEES